MQYGGNLDLFIPVPDEHSEYLMNNPNVGQRYFHKQTNIPNPTKDLFLKNKPENSYRIFVLGGSTAAGYPYGNNIKFSRILGFRLQELYPKRAIEVVNVAMSAVGSYTLLDLVNEVLDQEPDAILIYAGHNEYYGALSVASMESLGRNPFIVRSYLKLIRLKSFLLLRELVGWVKGNSKSSQMNNELENSTGTLMERIVGEQQIPFNSTLYEAGKSQFESNLSIIIERSQRQGVEVVLSELVSNIRDQAPFISVDDGDGNTALNSFNQARLLEKNGAYIDARINYLVAKDTDALRFRAAEDMNSIIHSLARNYQLHVVPMQQAFKAVATHGLIGDELMVDHLHPNIDGYFIMADAFFNTFQQKTIIGVPAPGVQATNAETWKQKWGISPLDSGVAELNIRYLKGGWPFKEKWEPNLSFENYKPKEIEKKLALEVVTNSALGLESAHIQLANEYKKKGDLGKAAETYLSLIHAIPFELSFYQEAVDLLFQLKRYAEAKYILEIGVNHGHGKWAHKMLSQSKLMLGDIAGAIPDLEMALQNNPDDESVISNLHQAYLYMEKSDEVSELVNLLEDRNASLDLLMKLNDQRNITRSKNTAVKDLLDRAQALLKQTEYQEAEKLLLSSIQIKPSATAYQWLGQIAVIHHQSAKAREYFEKGLKFQPLDEYMLKEFGRLNDLQD